MSLVRCGVQQLLGQGGRVQLSVARASGSGHLATLEPHAPAPRTSLLPLLAVQAQWSALISLSTPLLLKHAVLAQAAVVATTVACSRHRQRLSFSLCELSGQRYVQAAEMLSTVAACVLPPPLGGSLLEFQRQRLRQGPAAFHAVQVALLVSLAYCAVLWRLAGVERRMRAAYARRHRAVAEAQGLAAYRRCWLGSTALLLTAALWAFSCRTAVLLA